MSLVLKRKNFGLGSWGSTMMNTGARRMRIGWGQASNQYGMTNRFWKGAGNMVRGAAQTTLGLGAKAVKGAGIVGAGALVLGGLGANAIKNAATDG